MQDLRFSIVIPTRERAETLKYCLKTCIEQEQFDNYEIVVSDNNSSPATKQVIDELKSEKIRYFFTGKTLAMYENFEFAVSKARGEYVIVLGSDDGLLLKALYNLDRIIKKTNYKAIAWRWILYYWPEGVPLGCENTLHIPISTNVEVVNGKKRIKEVVKYKTTYNYLPMLYINGAIHRDLISELRNKTGRVFSSVTPDCYSAFSFGYLSKNFLFIDSPLSIAGMSENANGNNQFNKTSENKITTEFNALNSSSSIRFHNKIPNIRSMNAIVSEVFMQAKEKVFYDEKDLILDRKMMILKSLEDLRVFNINEWESSMEIIKNSLRDNVSLSKWFEKLLLHTKPKITDLNHKQIVKKGIYDGTLILDGFSFGCKNVYEVAQFYNKNFETDILIPEILLSNSIRQPFKYLLKKGYDRVKQAARIVVKGY